MKGGNTKKWVKCLNDINVIFRKGRFYSIDYLTETTAIIIDELGNRVGFNRYSSNFNWNFKIIWSHKRKNKLIMK